MRLARSAHDVVLRQLKLGPEHDRRVIEERIEQFVDMLFRDKLGQNRAVPFHEAGYTPTNLSGDPPTSPLQSRNSDSVPTPTIADLPCCMRLASRRLTCRWS